MCGCVWVGGGLFFFFFPSQPLISPLQSCAVAQRRIQHCQWKTAGRELICGKKRRTIDGKEKKITPLFALLGVAKVNGELFLKGMRGAVLTEELCLFMQAADCCWCIFALISRDVGLTVLTAIPEICKTQHLPDSFWCPTLILKDHGWLDKTMTLQHY